MFVRPLAIPALLLSLGILPGLASAEDPKATVDEVIAKVDEAATYLHDRGQAGFQDFNNNARWVWKDSYVFVFNCKDDRMIAHPLRPDLVGKPILGMQDEKGHLLFKDLCAAGRNSGGGWVEYWWPKPGEAKASRKISYAKQTEVSFQSDVKVGAGIYDESVSVDALNERVRQAASGQGVKDAP